MNKAEVIYDKDGKPFRVHIDDGFCMSSEAYDENEYGYLRKMLDPGRFSAIQMGRQVEALVNMVNELTKENWQLQQQLDQWRKAAGF